MKNIIGLSGLATSGKDLFFELLSKEIKCKKFSFADSLKQVLKGRILKEYGINVFDCSPEEKKTIRPILVEYGTQKRRESEGQYWIEKLTRAINESDADDDTTAVITDVRYNVYANDEVSWLKEKLKGTLVYIKKYKLTKDGIVMYTSPPNDEERRNDPLVKGTADYTVNWEHLSSSNHEEIKTKLRPYIINFLNWRKDNARRRRDTDKQLQGERLRQKL